MQLNFSSTLYFMQSCIFALGIELLGTKRIAGISIQRYFRASKN